MSVVNVTNTLCCLFTAALVLLLGNPWLIAMAKAKKAAEAPAAAAADDAGERFELQMVSMQFSVPATFPYL